MPVTLEDLIEVKESQRASGFTFALFEEQTGSTTTLTEDVTVSKLCNAISWSYLGNYHILNVTYNETEDSDVLNLIKKILSERPKLQAKYEEFNRMGQRINSTWFDNVTLTKFYTSSDLDAFLPVKKYELIFTSSKIT